MASQITGGSITFGRTIQAGQYEPKKAEATIHFTVSEGEHHGDIAAAASAEAERHVHKLLGLSIAEPALAPKQAPSSTGNGTVAVVEKPKVEIKPITDSELVEACANCRADTNNKAAIKELIAKFSKGPDNQPAKVGFIPKEDRANFLEQLKTIPAVEEAEVY